MSSFAETVAVTLQGRDWQNVQSLVTLSRSLTTRASARLATALSHPARTEEARLTVRVDTREADALLDVLPRALELRLRMVPPEYEDVRRSVRTRFSRARHALEAAFTQCSAPECTETVTRSAGYRCHHCGIFVCGRHQWDLPGAAGFCGPCVPAPTLQDHDM